MIYIDNRQDKLEITEEFKKKLEDVCLFALKEEEVEIDTEISMIFIDNEGIKDINQENRGIDRETDVLSFPMLDYPEKKVYKEVYKDYVFTEIDLDEGRLVLGDIVLSLEKALEQSNEYNHSYEREVAYLTVHSILHLLGYDHMEEEDKKMMRTREEEILNKLNIIR